MAELGGSKGDPAYPLPKVSAVIVGCVGWVVPLEPDLGAAEDLGDALGVVHGRGPPDELLAVEGDLLVEGGVGLGSRVGLNHTTPYIYIVNIYIYNYILYTGTGHTQHHIYVIYVYRHG